MSDVVLAQTPSILPQGILLPINAEPDYAYEQTMASSQTGSQGLTIFTTQANNYDVVTMVSASLSTSGTAGTRFMLLQVNREDGSVLFQIPAAVGQVASYAGFYTWSSTSSTAWAADAGTAGLYQVAALPPVLLYPGYSLILANLQHKAGDSVGVLSYTVTHIPTGPVGSNTDQPLVATPLVL